MIGTDLPGRCTACGLHPDKQGHRAPCEPSGPLHDQLLLEAQEAADKAMTTVSANHPQDAQLVDSVIEAYCQIGGAFSLNDLRPHLVGVQERNVIGSRMRVWSQRGRIRCVGRVASTEPGTHAREIRVWEPA